MKRESSFKYRYLLTPLQHMPHNRYCHICLVDKTTILFYFNRHVPFKIVGSGAGYLRLGAA